MQTLTIDPGVSGTGWALWDDSNLLAAGVLTSQKYLPWEERAGDVAHRVRGLLREHKAERMVIEWPLFYDDAGGHKVAKSGSLFELCALIGRIMQIADDHGILVKLVEARWKGQMPKEAMIGRIRKRMDIKIVVRTHAWDAVGIGLYDQGRW